MSPEYVSLDLFMWVVGGLASTCLMAVGWLIHAKNNALSKAHDAHKVADEAHDALAAYKLEVAEKYATTGYLQDVERRLNDMLTKLDGKLDQLFGPKAG